MRILLWGCTYSVWTVHFIEDFLVKNNYEIWILKTSNKEYYINLFEQQGVHLIECPSKVTDWYDGKIKYKFFYALYIHFLEIRTIVKAGRCDLINLHYVDGFDIIDVTILKYIMRAKLVLSYWGSDLFRVKENKLRLLGKFVKHADYITFENGDLCSKFEEIYKWKDKIDSGILLFGLPILDIIKEKQEKKSVLEIRKKWGFPENRVIIAIGHNASQEQQHIEVLKSIQKLGAEAKKQIFLLLQMTYDGTDEYKKSVIEAAERTGCKYQALERFLTDEEVAELRIVTDVFVHAQIDDAFSGSVCENLFCGTVLINAKWLKYQEFKEYDFKYLEFENIDEISKIITNVLEHKFDTSGNSELVWQLRSREVCVPKWEDLYWKVLNYYEKNTRHRS